MIKKIRGYTFIISRQALAIISHLSSLAIINHLNSLLWSGKDAIINARDPTHNPGQTRVFYKPGQTRLTRTKRDLVDPDNPMTRPGFNSGLYDC